MGDGRAVWRRGGMGEGGKGKCKGKAKGGRTKQKGTASARAAQQQASGVEGRDRGLAVHGQNPTEAKRPSLLRVQSRPLGFQHDLNCHPMDACAKRLQSFASQTLLP